MESQNICRLLLAGGLIAVSSLALTTPGAFGAEIILGNDNASVTARAGDFNVRDGEPEGSTVRDRLLASARRAQIPNVAMAELLRVFAYEFDLDQQVRPDDRFKVVARDDGAGQGALLAVELDFDGAVHKLYRFQTPDGIVDFYDEAGRSWRTRLARKPLAAGIMRSDFGPHTHPILGFTRMHTGVDWQADTGTPVYAAGDGKVVAASWAAGDGNRVQLQNADGFATAYAHLQAIAPGIRPGIRVRQGQVIGAVGSTGVSSGPHLHYEVLIDGRFVDPLRVALPSARVLDGATLAAFTRERGRLDERLRQTPAHDLAAPQQPL